MASNGCGTVAVISGPSMLPIPRALGISCTRRSASGNGSGHSHGALTMVKTMRLRPTAVAMVTVAKMK
jgi:hypothetical protein